MPLPSCSIFIFLFHSYLTYIYNKLIQLLYQITYFLTIYNMKKKRESLQVKHVRKCRHNTNFLTSFSFPNFLSSIYKCEIDFYHQTTSYYWVRPQTINICTFPIKHNYLFCKLKLLVEKYEHCQVETTNQYLVKIQIV